MAFSPSQSISTLSKRAQEVAKPDPNHSIWEVLDDQWHPEDNPNGYFSLGVAENRLMHDELKDYINTHINASTDIFTYGDGPRGSKPLRNAMARFLNKHLRPVTSIEVPHVTITNGVSHAIEHTSWCFADPGDAFLLGQPYYVAFMPDISLRPGVKVELVKFGSIDPMSIEAVSQYEHAILSARERNIKVKALMLCSPHNPLGRCYSRETLIAYLKLCQKYQIHFISDEIYALSIWENKEDSSPPPVPFTSVLSIPLEDDLINPSLVHVLWGMSKDFGANGLRVGTIISQSNPAFHQALTTVGIWSYASQLTEHVVTNILNDDNFTDFYIRTNQTRLSEAYSHVVSFLKRYNISYEPGANAAFFLWVDLGKAYLHTHPEKTPPTKEINKDIAAEISALLLKNKIFIGNGAAFGAEKPGLFRIVFTHPKEYIDLALQKMVKVLELEEGESGGKNVETEKSERQNVERGVEEARAKVEGL